jgi:hypothetical protein
VLGSEQTSRTFETLCYGDFKWEKASWGDVIDGAVAGGRSESGEILYVGRGWHNNALTPGEISPSHQCLLIGYGGNEICIREYEVLVLTHID